MFRPLGTLCLALMLSVTACDGGDDEDDGAADTDAQTTGNEDSASDAGTTANANPTTEGDASETSGGDETEGEGDDGDGSGGEEELPMPTMLPTVTGECPEFVEGDVTFSPAGTDPRPVKLWVSEEAKTKQGPLVFYWHGAGSNPNEAVVGLNPSFIEEVVAQGGIIAAPYHDPSQTQLPWYLTAGTAEYDLLVADEVLACAIRDLDIDVRRIHSVGLSAGGLHTSQFSFRRSGYLASVVTYSGGFIAGAPADQEPTNPLAALVFHGGPEDIVIVNFQDTSENYMAALESTGRLGILCNHGLGHTIPNEQVSVWRFLAAHPYGTDPSPYADGLPDGFPDYCTL